MAGLCKSFKDYERFDGNLMESVTGFVDPLKRDLAAKCFCRALGRLKRTVMEGTLDYFPLEGRSFDRPRYQQASAVVKPNKPKFEYAVVARPNQLPEDIAGVQNCKSILRSFVFEFEPSSIGLVEDEAWLKGLKRSHVHGRSHWWTYHLLVKRHIFLPVTFEPEPSTSMLTADELYRPLRTALYSILFGSAFSNQGAKEWSVTEYFFDTRKSDCHRVAFFSTSLFTHASFGGRVSSSRRQDALPRDQVQEQPRAQCVRLLLGQVQSAPQAHGRLSAGRQLSISPG